MFCSNCGNEIKENQKFCPKCGNGISSMPIKPDGMISESESLNIHNATAKKASSKKSIIGLCVTLGIALVIGIICGIVSHIVPKRVDFDLKLEQAEIQEFMNIVCENVDVESAQVGKVEVDTVHMNYDYGSAYVIVKGSGMDNETIGVSFYSGDDTDKIASIQVVFFPSESENEIACRNAIVEALEISICGSSSASLYMHMCDELPRNHSSHVIADYSLTGEENASISCEGFYFGRWCGTYRIYKN